jgi:molybdopterin-guanine dinucleotide biosynthesis protein A
MRGYVLAGGGSTRFGSDKALAEIGGKAVLVRMQELLIEVAGEVNVVAVPGQYAGLGVKSVADQWPGEGPLGGIITALEHTRENASQCAWNLIVGCDMPFLTREWMEFLMERAAENKAQVVLPHSAHGPEPLCACYRTDAGPLLQRAFENGVRKVTEALKQVVTEVLDEGDWKRFDTTGRLFWNMNTAADYEMARRAWEAEQK